MAPSYDPVQDFLGSSYSPDGKPDYVSSSPSALICVVPFANPVTYSRAKGSSASDAAYDGLATAPLVLIDTDIISLSIQQSKTSPVGSMGAALAFAGTDYLNLISPNDWVFAWIVNDDTQREDIKKRLASGQPCNKFSDGFKFVGRVSSIRKSFHQEPGGHKQVAYTLQGNSFKEFDTQVFYDPLFQEQVVGDFSYMARLTKGVNELFDPSSASGGSITTYTAFSTFIDLIVGSGVPKDAFSAGFPNAIPSTAVPTLPEENAAPYAYCVPAQVGAILNKFARTKPGDTACYADILEVLIGVQQYSNQLASPLTDETAGKAFAPDNVPQDQANQRRYTSMPLLGTFNPEQPKFDNRPLWSILTQYLNQAVNEMYTCLRVNPAGYVVPTLVVRQFPFSSELLDGGANTNNFTFGGTSPEDGQKSKTTFLSVPRWNLDPVLVTGVDLGKSDAFHFNFVHIYGDSDQTFPGDYSYVAARLENPPKSDSLDIKRTGMRLWPLQTVNCSGVDVQNGAAKRWMELAADFAMGQYMTLSGTINLMGIQAPIAPGDNCFYDNTVLHIEEVSHQFSMAGGARHFVTTLSVSHGVRADPTQTIQANPGYQFPDKFLYQNVLQGDLTTNDPGTTDVVFPLGDE